MPRTRLSNKKDGASKYEVYTEPASDFTSDERGNAEVVESEVVYFINENANDEDEGAFESPPYNKRRGGIGSSDKGGDFNEALEKN